MEFIKNIAHGGESSNTSQQKPKSSNKHNDAHDSNSSSGFLGGISDKLNSVAGGGRQSEANEDYLDKGIDFIQEKLGQGKQDNESVIEQAKDKQIANAIRSMQKSVTGKEMPNDPRHKN